MFSSQSHFWSNKSKKRQSKFQTNRNVSPNKLYTYTPSYQQQDPSAKVKVLNVNINQKIPINSTILENMKIFFKSRANAHGIANLAYIIDQFKKCQPESDFPNCSLPLVQAMIRELSRLYTLHAIKEKISWSNFEYLLVTKTNIELPIINYTERDEYSKRLNELDTFTTQHINHIVKNLPTFYPPTHQLHQQQQQQLPSISYAAKLRNDINISLNRHYSIYTSPSKIPTTLSSSSAITLAAMNNINNIITSPSLTPNNTNIINTTAAATGTATGTTAAALPYENNYEKDVSMIVEDKMNNKFIIPSYDQHDDDEEEASSHIMITDDDEDDDNLYSDMATTINEEVIHTLINARFTPIPSDELKKLKDVLRNANNNADEVVKDCFNTEMTQYKMSCLRPRTWLNDEVINFYMNMLQARDTLLCNEYPGRRSSHYFNSFFIERLLITDKKYNYNNIKRWSKKFDIFSKDKIFCPVNLSNTHWTLAVVYIVLKEIHYYDSMSGSGDMYLKGLLNWVQDEAKERKGIVLDVNEWKLINREHHVPQQMNGVDCGVFATICADYISDDLPLEYEQDQMLFFREKIGTDILRGHLLYPLKAIRITDTSLNSNSNN